MTLACHSFHEQIDPLLYRQFTFRIESRRAMLLGQMDISSCNGRCYGPDAKICNTNRTTIGTESIQL
ncbi:hypothetical protein SISSUDRAFT_1048412 [Sistotremastrum suecicum HHB10207 ss-3]|uniref:Uncharacterized protein n=1 Tax=Sistotremastrum suecicum HHB10207 ss-3 TaxID=1314776 RepID=A0A166CJT6_9AGAM|nr:hypothetical protein SISSUDRAFT_1048412 [Sistotremastrum suecicum HHB10207 ss-3]